MLLRYGGLPNFPKAPRPSPQPLLSARPLPLWAPQPVLDMSLHPALGPIDQEWLGGSWLGGREAGGDWEGERRLCHVTAGPPALLPHSTAPGAGQAQPVASDSTVRGWLGEGTLHSLEPGSPLQTPGAQLRRRSET